MTNQQDRDSTYQYANSEPKISDVQKYSLTIAQIQFKIPR